MLGPTGSLTRPLLEQG